MERRALSRPVCMSVSVWLCLPGKTDVVRHRFCEATDAFLGGLRDWLHV